MHNEDLKKMCRDEFEAYHIYTYLSKYLMSDDKVRKVFKDASKDEWKHYQILSKVVGDCSSKVSSIKAMLYFIIAVLFGTTITLKLMEYSEKSALKSYKTFAEVNNTSSSFVTELIKDEEIHERNFFNNLDERRIKYLSSIALGVSDALVELTGIYAGALGALSSTTNAGLVGILAGISATLSMSVASYTQAKQEVGKSPKLSALYTGLAYFAVVMALAIPYFLTASILTAFSSMLIIAIAIIAYISFYSSVLYEKSYLREFAEGTSLLLGVSFMLYLIGNTLGISIT
ncbi:MAG: ferritin family protein [Sulfolobales archaeon]|nr:hypothetical protein [Sulfolobales archaeon]MCX8186733.1 hypothetical protein [Sulfolobales archaeon]MDW7969694.1 ferritin family protein [Sulfolobales archaeon]